MSSQETTQETARHPPLRKPLAPSEGVGGQGVFPERGVEMPPDLLSEPTRLTMDLVRDILETAGRDMTPEELGVQAQFPARRLASQIASWQGEVSRVRALRDSRRVVAYRYVTEVHPEYCGDDIVTLRNRIMDLDNEVVFLNQRIAALEHELRQARAKA